MALVQKKYKICKRLGAGVHDKCQTQKFVLSQARAAKSRGSRRPPRKTDYAIALLDKQRVRFTYGVHEKQFANYVKASIKKHSAEKNSATLLFENLESRLDNVIYRLGIAHTRSFSRQLVSHGHFMVNGKRTTVPSHQVKVGDVITLREASKGKKVFEDLAKRLKNVKTPGWLSMNLQKLSAEVKGVPTDPDPFLSFQSVVEFYSK